MDTEGQKPIRWLILTALLLGGAVWYSWTAHKGSEQPRTQAFAPPPRDQAEVTSAGVEVAQPSGTAEPPTQE